MTTRLSAAPDFETVRSGTGAVAADSATINTTNYPRTLSVEGRGASHVALYWGATGAAETHYLDLQILTWAGEQWVEGATFLGVRPGKAVVLPLNGASVFAVRVRNAVAAGATDLRVYAALAE